MKRIKLNNCPFCGGKVNLYKGTTFFTASYYIKCHKCGASQQKVETDVGLMRKGADGHLYCDPIHKTDKEAIKEVIRKWNKPITE